MKALITGASSGIGKEVALYLSDLGYDIIIVGRNDSKLREIRNMVKTKVEIVKMDLNHYRTFVNMSLQCFSMEFLI